MIETLQHILDLAAENTKGQDGYEMIAEWARHIVTVKPTPACPVCSRDENTDIGAMDSLHWWRWRCRGCGVVVVESIGGGS